MLDGLSAWPGVDLRVNATSWGLSGLPGGLGDSVPSHPFDAFQPKTLIICPLSCAAVSSAGERLRWR